MSKHSETGECNRTSEIEPFDFNFVDKGELKFYKSGSFVYAAGTLKNDSTGIHLWTSNDGKNFNSNKITDVSGQIKEFKLYAEQERLIFGVVTKDVDNNDIFNFYYSPDGGNTIEHCNPLGPYDIIDFNVLFESDKEGEIVARIFTRQGNGIEIYASRWW